MIDYSTMLNAWYQNQGIIREYFQSNDKKDKNEGYQIDSKMSEKEEKDLRNAATILGIGVGLFVLLFILSTIFFIWGLYLLIVYWNQLPTWAALLGIVGLFFFPLITVILVYAIRDRDYSSPRSSPRSPKRKSSS